MTALEAGALPKTALPPLTVIEVVTPLTSAMT